MAAYLEWLKPPNGGLYQFPGFPGIYGPGIRVPLVDTMMSREELQKLIDEGDFPVRIVDDTPAVPPVKKPQEVEVKS